jgi:regulatory protein
MEGKKSRRRLNADHLWEYALRALGSRAMAVGELRQKLRTKAALPADVDGVVSRLRELGLVNDKQFAEHYAARRLENEGFGKARVLAGLLARRVARPVAEKAVENAFDGADEIELIERYLERKYRKKPLAEVLSDPKGLASAYRKLRAAGFSGGNSLRVLKKHTSDLEALDAMEMDDPSQTG